MKPQITKLTLSLATILTLGVTSVQAENLLQNGSFENFSVLKEKTNWKQVDLDGWNETSKVTINGKEALDGTSKVALDSSKSLNQLTQNITTINGATYTLSVDAYSSRKQLSSADIEFVVDGEVIEVFTPTSDWANYQATFVGTGEAQVVGFKEVDAQNNNKGAFLDNAQLSVDETTVVVVPPSNNLLTPSTQLVPADFNIAKRFGKATQGQHVRGLPHESLAIDGDVSTNNESCRSRYINWWGLELPEGIKVSTVKIDVLDGTKKDVNKAKVYLRSETFVSNDPLDDNDVIATLEKEDKQEVVVNSEAEGNNILIKYDRSKCLKLSEVEVYGSLPTTPVFSNESYTQKINLWQPKGVAIFNVGAVDYQGDKLNYQIVTQDVPFAIDENGVISVSQKLVEGEYRFEVGIDDGNSGRTQEVVVQVERATHLDTLEKLQSNNQKPELKAKLPNFYDEGATIFVEVGAERYSPTIQDNEWVIAKDTLKNPLGVGFHNVTVIVGDEQITYDKFIEIGGERVVEFTQNISAQTIENVSIAVESSTSVIPTPSSRFRGTSVSLFVEDGKVILENKSYRTLKSLLGKYDDSQGKGVLVKLDFTQNIEPFSKTTLATFDHAESMKIVKTANKFDMELGFNGTECSAKDAEEQRTKYCRPTNALESSYSPTASANDEYKVYGTMIAAYNHFFNSVHNFKVMKAWMNQSTYDGYNYKDAVIKAHNSINETSSYGTESQIYDRFFNIVTPNHYQQLLVMRFKKAVGAGGVGGGWFPSLLGKNTGWGWSSVWEERVNLNNEAQSNLFEALFHEMMHGIGLWHGSGMTYGLSNIMGRVVMPKYYSNGKPYLTTPPVAVVPKYLFETTMLDDTRIQLKFYKTSEATKNALTIEAFGAKVFRDNDLTVESVEGDTMVLKMDEGIINRFFLTLYGDDSLEVMSQLITKVD